MTAVLFAILDKIIEPEAVFAHCDIPCGIYDPHEAQVNAHTILRMTMMLDELKGSDAKTASQASRLTKVKEEGAEALKNQVRVIWGDYFNKPEIIEKFPDLHDLVFKIMKQASTTRQEVTVKGAQELLSSVQKFAEIFWESKNRETVRVKSGFPTEGEIVLPK